MAKMFEIETYLRFLQRFAPFSMALYVPSAVFRNGCIDLYEWYTVGKPINYYL